MCSFFSVSVSAAPRSRYFSHLGLGRTEIEPVRSFTKKNQNNTKKTHQNINFVPCKLYKKCFDSFSGKTLYVNHPNGSSRAQVSSYLRAVKNGAWTPFLSRDPTCMSMFCPILSFIDASSPFAQFFIRYIRKCK